MGGSVPGTYPGLEGHHATFIEALLKSPPEEHKLRGLDDAHIPSVGWAPPVFNLVVAH